MNEIFSNCHFRLYNANIEFFFAIRLIGLLFASTWFVPDEIFQVNF